VCFFVVEWWRARGIENDRIGLDGRARRRKGAGSVFYVNNAGGQFFWLGIIDKARQKYDKETQFVQGGGKETTRKDLCFFCFCLFAGRKEKVLIGGKGKGKDPRRGNRGKKGNAKKGEGGKTVRFFF
jgi:hypothetical protein